jgi:hypothetical protein
VEETALNIYREVLRAAQAEAHALSHEAVDTEHMLAGLARVTLPGLFPNIEVVRRALTIVSPALPLWAYGGPPPLYPHVAEIGASPLDEWANLDETDSANMRRRIYADTLWQLRVSEKGRVRELLHILES